MLGDSGTGRTATSGRWSWAGLRDSGLGGSSPKGLSTQTIVPIPNIETLDNPYLGTLDP